MSSKHFGHFQLIINMKPLIYFLLCPLNPPKGDLSCRFGVFCPPSGGMGGCIERALRSYMINSKVLICDFTQLQVFFQTSFPKIISSPIHPQKVLIN